MGRLKFVTLDCFLSLMFRSEWLFLKRRMDPVLKRGIDERTIDDGTRYSGHIRHGIGTPSHRVSPVLLLEHSNDDDVIGGIDPEPGAMHAAPVESACAVRAAVETRVRRIKYDANVHAIANPHERLQKVHRHAFGQQVRGHQLHRRRRQYPYAIELALIRKHLRETHVVLRRGVKPGNRQQVLRFYAWRCSSYGRNGD